MNMIFLFLAPTHGVKGVIPENLDMGNDYMHNLDEIKVFNMYKFIYV